MGTSPGAAEAVAFVDTLNQVILFPLIGLLMGVAFLIFLYGCAEYIMGATNPASREKGVQHITWGIVGLVIMVSAWGILSLTVATFGLENDLQNAQQGTFPAPGSSTGSSPTPGTGSSPVPGSGSSPTP